jgi:hypothetical protein
VRIDLVHGDTIALTAPATVCPADPAPGFRKARQS